MLSKLLKSHASTRRLNRMAKNFTGFLCFSLILSTYVFYPLYKAYKLSTKKRAGK